MENTGYRLIFEGMRNFAQPDIIISSFKKELEFDETRIRAAFTSPPRVLAQSDDKDYLSRIRQQIEEAGGRIRMEAMVDDPACPYSLPLGVHKRIRHEIDKASKGEFVFALIVIRLIPLSGQTIVPSAIDVLCNRIEAVVEPYVAVLPVDDTNLILIDFFADFARIRDLTEKLDDLLGNMLKDTATILRGSSFFPENGTTVSALIQAAENNTHAMAHSSRQGEIDVEGRLSLEAVIKDSESASDMLQQALISARGKKFKWISELPLDQLWLGLGSMPRVRQKEFLCRLPLDSQLAGPIEKAIQTRKTAPSGPDDERKIEELLIKVSGFDHEDRYGHLKEEITEKLKDIDSLPTLSKVALAVVDIARNPSSDISELTSVIKNDPALTLAILKVVNSAFYGLPQKIDTIERAVVLLGREDVINLALGIGASQALDMPEGKGFYQPQILWHHLMGTALICRYLIKKYHKKDEPVLFTAGLLHDFGKIFLVRHYAEFYDKLHIDAVEYAIPLYELEEECFGINHAMIGKYIGSNWNLPEPLIEAAAFHHQPFFATEYPELAAFIGFADYLYHQTGMSNEISDLPSANPSGLTYGHWEIIQKECPGIKCDDMEALILEARAFIEENQQIFKIII